MSVSVDPLISFVLELAGDSVINEVRFLSGVKKEVEEMQSELRWMQSFLEDADSLDVGAQTSVDRQMVSEIREQSLEAEDVVDSYLVKLALRKRGGILNKFACIVKETRDIHEVGSKIESVKSKLATLRTRLQTYGIVRDLRAGEASSTSFRGQAQPWQRRTYGHIVDRNIVGLDGKTEEVVGLFLREEEPCRVVSMAWAAWGRPLLPRKFITTIKSEVISTNLYGCVSQKFNPRDVLEAIYIELTSPSPEQRKEIARLKDDEIVSKLYQLQKDRKCFIVLDDIWSTGAWNTISAAFPMEETATGSKILFTTRNKELGEHVDRRGSYGGLEPLSPDQSWELLQKIAFAGRDGHNIGNNESMKKLGKEMIKHCGGLW